MGKYGVSFSDFTTDTTAKSAAGLNADGAGEEAEIVEFLMTGSGLATGVDTQHEAFVPFCTFGGVGTWTNSAVATPFNQKSAATVITNTTIATAEPTTVSATAIPLRWGFNQRGGMRWAVPQGEGLKVHNSQTNKGVVFQVDSVAAGKVSGHIHWWEP